MQEDQKMNKLAKDFRKQLRTFFGDRVDDIGIDEVSEDRNYPEFNIVFRFYGYFRVRFHYERGRIGFAIRYSENEYLSFRLSQKWWTDKLDIEAMFEELDYEARLRIPDKYLIAKGWMEAPQEDTAIVKALVLNHLKAEYQMNDKQAQDAWHYLVQAPDVLAEFKDYIVTGNFAPDDKSLKVEGYSAQALKETTYLSPLGSYNYLIYLRNNPSKALADLKAGLPKR